MLPTSGNRGGGLARYQSAPATWLEALLESVEEDGDDALLLKPPPPPPTTTANTPPPQQQQQNIAAATSYVADPGELYDGAPAGLGLFRQNSSPAEFITAGSDSIFANYESNYDFVPSPLSSSSKNHRSFARVSPQLKEEDRGGHLQRGLSGLLDPELEKILEDSVPCRVRAKRGCATHPRSIAERVRRTRISDRIRKLQELVPNMEKQTNTADMLEEAVEYVKLLQGQIQELKEQQKNCTCVHKD